MKTSFQLQLSSSTSSSGCNSIRWSPAASFSGLKTPALFRLKMIVKFCTPCRRAHEKQRAGSCSRVLEQECMFLNGFSCVDEKQMQSNNDLIMINHGSVAQATTRACTYPPFASDRVGLLASIWQRGDLSFYDGAGTARIGGSGWRRLLAGVPQCFRRISVLHAAY